MIDRALAPLEELHAKFVATDPHVLLTCGDRLPLIRYRTGEHEQVPLRKLKVALAQISRADLLRDANGRRLASREIVERFGVPIDAAEYDRLVLHRTRP
ncbi:MAG: hypothetical protein EOO73_34785 [Myxococcales bacterium]|nr:MAG: hypothetical protein EOO73_34785 [Myxococcales bacterium]